MRQSQELHSLQNEFPDKIWLIEKGYLHSKECRGLDLAVEFEVKH
ncbi:MAG TPA: hypothetical protein VD699_06535 [Nitrosopumilaceae archaeon]|nr:hypothetical protein [Nitrosopumilaceae archaeon]HXV39208.1 hypothetical protein [Nitrosopumilaceae archaeon]